MPEANGKAAVSKNGVKHEAKSQSPEKEESPAQAKKRLSKSPSSADVDRLDKGSKKRRKVNHACLYCRRSHMTCDLERPCARCVKRNIGHLCHDEPREPSKKQKGEEDGDAAGATASPSQQQTTNIFPNTSIGPLSSAFPQTQIADSANMAQRKSVGGPQTQFGGDNQQLLGYDDWNAGFQSQFHDNIMQYSMFNTSEVSNEYSLLNDFLTDSLMDDGTFYPQDDQASFVDTSLTNTIPPFAPSRTPLFTSQPSNQANQSSLATTGNSITRPSSRAPMDKKQKDAREAYFMAAADPDGTDNPEERMNRLLKAKYDAGFLRPFNYVQGYTRLNVFLEKNFHVSSRKRIAKELETFRPKFRERMQKLSDIELVLVEMWFERTLMEYDRVFASMAVPACCWRRTGEIFRGNKEMADLIHVPVTQLRDGKLAIHEIIVEDSLVSYWEKFSAIAFDESQKAILTSCSLKSPNPKSKDPELKCCFSFTIKRDSHHIPSLIIGHFLPILPLPSVPSSTEK